MPEEIPLRPFNDAAQIQAAHEIEAAPAAPPNLEDNATRQREMGRLHKVWFDLLFSDKSVSAVTTLYTFGYFISFLMNVWGAGYFMEFGRPSTVFLKFGVQIIGLVVSVVGVHASYRDQPKNLSLFFVNQLTHMVLILVGVYYVCRTSREELFEVYVTEPFYNIKLVDYPFGNEQQMIDMSTEPAYEVSLLYFRAIYMLIVASIFNIYALYSVGRKLWNQPVPREQQVHLVGQGDANARAVIGDRIPDEPRSFFGKVALLFGA